MSKLTIEDYRLDQINFPEGKKIPDPIKKIVWEWFERNKEKVIFSKVIIVRITIKLKHLRFILVALIGEPPSTVNVPEDLVLSD